MSCDQGKHNFNQGKCNFNQDQETIKLPLSLKCKVKICAQLIFLNAYKLEDASFRGFDDVLFYFMFCLSIC